MAGCFQSSAVHEDKRLTISIHLKHYVELNVDDNFSLPTLHRRLERHLASTWREPRRPIKAKLHVTQTTLCFTSASWWPYRRVTQAEFKRINRLVTFHRFDCHFAIGLVDPDFAEKQFVVMSTKSINGLNQLIKMMEPHIVIVRNVESEVMRKLIHSSRSTLQNNDYKSNQSLMFPSSESRLKTSSRNVAVDPISCVSLPLLSCRCETKSSVEKPTNGHKSDGVIINCNPRRLERKVKAEEDGYRHGTITNLDETDVVGSTNTRTFAKQVTDDSGKRWEVDMKYVRFDPQLGNVVDDEFGSVYLYTAREVLS